MSGSLSVRDEPEPGARVDEELGRVVVARDAVLAAGVVKRVRVMPVVPALAEDGYGSDHALARTDVVVVRPVAVLVRNWVDQPGCVQHHDVSGESEQKHAQPVGVEPEHAVQTGQHIAEQHTHFHVVAVLEHHNRVFLQVGHIQRLAPAEHVGMLVHQQPADVREPEAALRVVRVAVCFAELVMDSVVAAPVVDRPLMARAAQQHEKQTDGTASFVAAMRPKTMRSGRDSKPSKLPNPKQLDEHAHWLWVHHP